MNATDPSMLDRIEPDPIEEQAPAAVSNLPAQVQEVLAPVPLFFEARVSEALPAEWVSLGPPEFESKGAAPVLEPTLETRTPDPSFAPADDPYSEISRFSGVVVHMGFMAGARPRIQVVYGTHRALVGVDPIQLLEGEVPPVVLALVIEWVLLHQSELLECWERGRQGGPFWKISPLD
jgi:hypothetical protein